MSRRLTSLCFAFVINGCGNAPVQVESPDEAMSFEEFLSRTHYHAADDTYVVEGDISIVGRDALEDYFYTVVAPNDGALARKFLIPSVERLKITYCIERPFILVEDDGTEIDRTEEVGNLFRDATREWEGSANVDFVHVSEANCAPGAATYFAIRPINFSVEDPERPDWVASAPFPNFRVVNRILYLDPRAFNIDLPPKGVVLHELGHVLGFIHENAGHPDSPDRCEDSSFVTTLTPYDTQSIMNTGACSGSLGNSFSNLSSRDRSGAATAYGVPASNRLSAELTRSLYHVTLGRAPDPDGFTYWEPIMRTSRSRCDGAIQNFFELGLSTGRWSSDSLFLESLYFVIFDRAPDQGGFDYWLGELRSGYPRDHLLRFFLEPTENPDETTICERIN